MSQWRQTIVGDEIELAYGKSLPAHDRQAGTIAVYGSNGVVGTHTESLVAGPGIVVGRKGSVGAVRFSDTDFWPIDTTYYVVNRGDHNWRYLYYLLLTCGLTGLNSHSAVPGLNREDVYAIEVQLPPRSEQDKIACALDCIDDAMELEARALRHAVELRRATMRELFTRGLRGRDPQETDLGICPGDWEIIKIRDLGRIVTGTTPPTKDSGNYDGGTTPFVAPGDFGHGDRIASTAKKLSERGLGLSRPLPASSTCVVCIGSTIGKVGFTTADLCATNQQINSVIASADFEPRYVFYLLVHWSEHIKRHASPSPVPILSKGAFETIEIATSKDLGEQANIAHFLGELDRKVDLHRRKHGVLDELYRSLLAGLIAGDINIDDLDLTALPVAEEPLEKVTA